MDWKSRASHESGRDRWILERIVMIARIERPAPIVVRLATFTRVSDGNVGRSMMRVHFEGRSDDVQVDLGGVCVSRVGGIGRIKRVMYVCVKGATRDWSWDP
jgi:hypothetical protein